MILHLDRSSYGPIATEGMWTVGTLKLPSIEQPWNNNHPDTSCVPDGVYDLIPYESPKHGQTWCLSNPRLGIFKDVTAGARDHCELHSANWASQLEGCIALGLTNNPMVDPSTGVMSPAVNSSVAAIAMLMKALGPMTTGHTLYIAPAPGVQGTDGYVFNR